MNMKKNGEKANDSEEEDISEGETPKKKKNSYKSRYNMSLWQAKELKRQLDIPESISDIMQWSKEEKISCINERLMNMTKYNTHQKIYNKLLIFICGNLDEAYSMSNDVSDADVDADILYEFTKNINILNIKEALLNKFKPEQIARFGNNHIIYPSLNKTNFENLILKRVEKIKSRIKNKFDINLSFSNQVYQAIYENGVYPTQGTRPLFSTINNIIENSLPYFIFTAKLWNLNNLNINIDKNESLLFSNTDKGKIERKVILSLDEIKNNTTVDEIALVSAHETGHAVAYVLLFKTVPKQIVGNAIISHTKGFVIPHQHSDSLCFIENTVKIYLAGTIAEELIFGKKHKTSGCQSDILKATAEIAKMVRFYNMTKRIGMVYPESAEGAGVKVNDMKKTGKEIEKRLKKIKKKTRSLLKSNMKFYKAILKLVLEKKRILPEDFYEVARDFIPGLKIRENDYTITEKFNGILENFLNG